MRKLGEGESHNFQCWRHHKSLSCSHAIKLLNWSFCLHKRHRACLNSVPLSAHSWEASLHVRIRALIADSPGYTTWKWRQHHSSAHSSESSDKPFQFPENTTGSTEHFTLDSDLWLSAYNGILEINRLANANLFILSKLPSETIDLWGIKSSRCSNRFGGCFQDPAHRRSDIRSLLLIGPADVPSEALSE